MSTDISSLLAQKNFRQPPEIAAIKAYVAEHFDGRSVGVALTPDSIIVTVTSAAFAGSLKNHTRQLQAAADTTKRIVLRIG